MRVTVDLPTKGRYDTLICTLQALSAQTYKSFDIIITDDTDSPQDLRSLPQYQNILRLLNQYGIGWVVKFGRKLGQHHSHQVVQEEAKTDWIWRIDDDEVPEPDTLRRLLVHAGRKVGAVAGLVLPPFPSPVPDNANNLIKDLSLPNVQWFTYPKGARTIEVEHLHSTFLYRRGVAKYDLALSPAAHREETLFTHEILRAGYKLLVDTTVTTWHFQAGHGGIRSHQDARFWYEDEQLFNDKLLEWGVHGAPLKHIVLDNGRGDHVIVKSLIPRLKAKYKNIIIASCFNDVFSGDDVPLISIAQAQQTLGNIENRFSVYKWCMDYNFNGELVDAFAQMYGI